MRWMTKTALLGGLVLAPLTAQASHEPPEAFRSEVASVWFDRLYQVIRSESASPPAASRIYGITAVALHESMAPRSIRYRPLVGQLNGLDFVPKPQHNKVYHWPAVGNAVLARTIRGLMPSLTPANAAAIAALEAAFLEEFEDDVPAPVLERSVRHGQDVADAILDWAAGDGLPEIDNCPYVPAPVAGAWVPTPPAFIATPLQPCWGQLRTLVLETGDECAPEGNPVFSEEEGSEFHDAAREVHDVGQNLTEEQRTIALFWADNPGATGTPAGHWIGLVGQFARRRHLSLATAASAYARVGIAVHDAFATCWQGKYVYNLQRPVTYIQNHIDSDWLSFLVTPPFPAYASGHSTQSGAAAEVLTEMFGNANFTDTLREDMGLVPPLEPRTFTSFRKAAREAAVSRLYGGIHFTFDNDHGLKAGKCVGRAIRHRVDFDRGH